MGNVSEQFRVFTGLGDPDPSLGLENARGKSGGEPVDTGDTLGLDEVDVDHIDGEETDGETDGEETETDGEETEPDGEETEPEDRGPVPNGYDSWEEHDRVSAELAELEAQEHTEPVQSAESESGE